MTGTEQPHEDDPTTDSGAPMTSTDRTGADTTTTGYGTTDYSTVDSAYRPFPDQPLDAPLPYGSGFAPTQQFGYGVTPEPVAETSTEVARRERAGSPILAIAGLLSMGVAVWAILGAPAISTAVMLAAGLVVAVLVGLLLVVRR